jgi:hypothetical protein
MLLKHTKVVTKAYESIKESARLALKMPSNA